MFDCAPATHSQLSHDMPCGRCGHARHPYLACSETCSCSSSGSLPASTAAPRQRSPQDLRRG